jgi:catechol 2,3-dioxygenase-like lactoylglutathione lyase family enzyme
MVACSDSLGNPFPEQKSRVPHGTHRAMCPGTWGLQQARKLPQSRFKMSGLIHNLGLTVKDPWASRAFYDAVLGFMGYRLARVEVRGFDWELTTQGGGFSSIGLMKAQGPGLLRVHDRYAPGLHHVAWHADSRGDVDNLQAADRNRCHGARSPSRLSHLW